MTCDERQKFLHAYIDGELDLSKSIEIEQHLNSCDTCFQTYKQHRTLHTSLKQSALYYEAPRELQRRITASVKATDRSRSLSSRIRDFSPRFLTLAASFAVVALVAWNFGRLTRPPQSDAVSQQVLESHMRSLLVNHLTDVPSSDQHTVKPWFNGKTNFSPVVRDLSAQGFPLIGGRLDYVNDLRVAALVYQRHQHVINLFTWASPDEAERQANSMTGKGYNLFAWNKAGMSYYAVSDLNSTELQEFVQLIQN
ncbi:MAG TPA: anti-sigma factor [Bacteroidota bacterium]|jgi:anti-sigma factor RsiW|nr:anti-sigma factor [Bacteroidota bacterium]